MKIGYPCVNTEVGCSSSRTFRLASYSEERLIDTIQENINCLKKVLDFNLKNKIFFFRITSDIVPFASHPVCTYNWKKHFESQFKEIGSFIKTHKMRVAMHPDQFILINALDKDIVKRSVKELEYHADLLDIIEADHSAKIQIHVGGVYGDKKKSMARFIKEYANLPKKIKNRLVIENDDYKYSLKDCIEIHSKTGIPIVFDTLHHDCLNNGETYKEAISKSSKTWKDLPIVDYSTQDPEKKKGAHTQSVDLKHFKSFIEETKNFDFDIMLEIKDKQKSAIKVINSGIVSN